MRPPGGLMQCRTCRAVPCSRTLNSTIAIRIRRASIFGWGLEECDPILGAGCVGPELGYVVSVVQPVDAPCASASLAINHTVDNATEVLNLNLQLGAFDETNVLRSVVIGYKLQVSPAPATATFRDVPTSHPYFRFIEALAASGITAGCGDGNYCPDDPLTRGQIESFLAKALGLNWSQ